jgi:ABC-2 type transport system ATP-binding protein
MGYDIQKQAFDAKEQMGVVTDISNVYLDLSAQENLIFTGKLYGLPKDRRLQKARELLEMFGLYDVRHESVKGFSGGMKRRLTIAMALVNDARVLFLDEPTTALDVQSVRVIHELIMRLNSSGTTIFLTTHNMTEASELCNRVAIISQGRIATIDTPEKLRQAMDRVHSVEVVFDSNSSHLAKEMEELQGVREVQKRGNKFRLLTLHPPDVLRGILQFSERNDLQLLSVNTLSPSLEDVFLEMTGEEIVERSKHREKGPGKRGSGEPRRSGC